MTGTMVPSTINELRLHRGSISSNLSELAKRSLSVDVERWVTQARATLRNATQRDATRHVIFSEV